MTNHPKFTESHDSAARSVPLTCGFVMNDQGWIPDVCGLPRGHEGDHVWSGLIVTCKKCGKLQAEHGMFSTIEHRFEFPWQSSADEAPTGVE